jgi:glycosyltransferase involved in cell wall biosynthesis
MRIHLLAPPNVQTTKEYYLDGFCTATIRFARLLRLLGHTVFLYASEDNDAPCDELVTIITKEEQAEATGGCEYYREIPSASHPEWVIANVRTIREIGKRKQPRDLICSIGGLAQKPIADAHPELMFVEYCVGYLGTFSPYRVFQSNAWRHYIYGRSNDLTGRYFEDVIPAFLEPEEFPFRETKEPFVLYVGRLDTVKGIYVACESAKRAGVPLKIMGPGDFNNGMSYGEYLGTPDEKTRNEWMSRASAVICPTQYLEPFGSIAAEAQMCGTPVISTDFGAFTETVENLRTGFRCRYLGEFVEAIRQVKTLDFGYIRDMAIKKFSLHSAMYEYDRYFKRLELLWDNGWNTCG